MPIPRPIPKPKPKPTPKPTPEPVVESCVLEGADLMRDGGYQVRQRKVGKISVYEPVVSGCKMPVYHHGNGTGAFTGFYRTQMKRMSSHGYLAVSYETTQSGSGKGALEATDWALARNDTLPLVVSAGHSQGGQCAASLHFLLEQKYGDSIKVASVGEQPAFGMSRYSYAREIPQLKGATFLIHGTRDTTVPASWVRRGARLYKNDVTWYAAEGATHMNVQPFAATGGLAFGNCKLLEHKDACEFFEVVMPNSREWTKVRL